IQVMAVAAGLLLMVGLGATGLRWLWKRTGGAPALGADELEDLRHRLTELEAERGRVAELEERVDFAERLLAKSNEPEQLKRGD
ncbi:MAG TPA: hypothetical protein VF454_03295, partial [Gemmatimonadales bacterium]